MTVPKHFKFTFRGTFGATPEGWSFGLKFQQTAELNSDAHLENINEGAVTAAVQAFLGGGLFTTGIKTTDWRAYEIGTNGLMSSNGPLLHTFPTPIAGTATSENHPSQCALAVTTVAQQRGPAHMGRFYLPLTHMVLGTDWRLSDASCDAIIGQAVTFVKAISGAIDLPNNPGSAQMCNISSGPSGGSTGTFKAVHHLELGKVYDTLRNRRKSLLEERRVGAQIDW